MVDETKHDPSAMEFQGIFTNVSEITGNHTLQLAPELIGGFLRRGHKAMLTGPPKAGKSWASIQLAYAVANGWEWLDFKCEQGKVCIINSELDDRSFSNRCNNVARAICPDVNPDTISHMGANIDVLNLRGTKMGIDDVIRGLEARYAEDFPDLIIIDPIYKLLEGEENDNSDMRYFVAKLDHLASKGSAVFFTHHHAKGTAGSKSVVDRGAGAGVFGRDPDAIIDLNPLEIPEDSAEEEMLNMKFAGANIVPLRANFVLREFPDPGCINIVFSWPLLSIVDGLDDIKERGSLGAARRRGNDARKKQFQELREKRDKDIRKIYNTLVNSSEKPTPLAIWEELIEFDDYKDLKFKTFKNMLTPKGASNWIYDKELDKIVYIEH